MVLMGTENRQHILGHLGLLGMHGSPEFPLSADGPEESSIGDPLWTSLADWADRCREREGVAIAVHFPKPLGEIAADIVLGKIDAVEMYPYAADCFDTFRFQEWYRYLNCGYRLPAVGGTDKMQAAVPVGANRTYAYLGHEEFSMERWAQAIRQGNTFMTTGPLLLLQVDGRKPGEEITVKQGGGTMDVLAEASSFRALPSTRDRLERTCSLDKRRARRDSDNGLTGPNPIARGWLACSQMLVPARSHSLPPNGRRPHLACLCADSRRGDGQ